MADKLTDPNKPAHEIIEVLEDGDAIRNDGVRLTAANKNPWYVLATIYGEQPEGASFDKGLTAKNRRAWNGWFCAELSEEERADRAKKTGLDVADLMPLGNEELADITERFRERMGDKTAELPSRTENIDFSQLHFSRFVNFEKFVFEKTAGFYDATFSDVAWFRHATFCKQASFTSARFIDKSDFCDTFFGGKVNFGSVTFGHDVYFNRAKFYMLAQYNAARFSREVWFLDSLFSRSVSFRYTSIGMPSFRRTTFIGSADFSSAKFISTTRFTEAQFLTHVPEFHAAELYDDTVFPTPDKYTDNWPPLKGSVKVEGLDEPIPIMPAADQKRAYNRLRLFMNKSLQIDEEQFFHRQEMRCKREIEKKWWMRCLYDIFEGVSDYGISIGRPAFWLVVFWLFGMIAKLKPAADGWWPDYHSILPAMGWSFANLFSFFGFQRRYFDEEKLIMLLKLVGGVQTVVGFILLFFLGLGLRNRFRLR